MKIFSFNCIEYAVSSNINNLKSFVKMEEFPNKTMKFDQNELPNDYLEDNDIDASIFNITINDFVQKFKRISSIELKNNQILSKNISITCNKENRKNVRNLTINLISTEWTNEAFIYTIDICSLLNQQCFPNKIVEKDTQYNITNLEPCSNYKFIVKVTNLNSIGVTVTGTTSYNVTKIGDIRELVAHTTTNKIMLNWKPTENFSACINNYLVTQCLEDICNNILVAHENYISLNLKSCEKYFFIIDNELFHYRVTIDSQTTTKQVTGTNITISDLCACTSYSIYINAVDEDNNDGEMAIMQTRTSKKINSIKTVTLENVLSAPSPNVTNITYSQFIFFWKLPSYLAENLLEFELVFEAEICFPIPDWCKQIALKTIKHFNRSTFIFEYFNATAFTNYKAKIKARTTAGYFNVFVHGIRTNYFTFKKYISNNIYKNDAIIVNLKELVHSNSADISNLNTPLKNTVRTGVLCHLKLGRQWVKVGSRTNSIINYGEVKAVKYTLGEDINCKEISSRKTIDCNGPLKSNTWYHVRMRAFSHGGYSDSTTFLIKTNGVVFGILFLRILSTMTLLFRKCSRHIKNISNKTYLDSRRKSFNDHKSYLVHCQQLIDNPGKQRNEFQLLQTLSVDLQMPTKPACLQANKEKNRYSDILPYYFLRVKLVVIENDPNTDYINASFIKVNKHTIICLH
ncbi:Tyrosine-protein phosphatase 10D [Melipona quadrifasciata]|uniref:Tyrosine-protein phosphatase 10D n=1 Tax=Melipona quadrifasciata TaxID=166423 RepID=A0A0N0BBR7_9HYME|nr:Tyrosine-protein phosphatase 10D [Melipona quadrifasciata]